MNFLLRKTKDMLVRYAQTLLVLLAFGLMVFSSYFFVSRTENNHLKRSAENAILFTEANIKADMQELETLLDVVSQTIGDMIINGETSEAVNRYILFINNYVEAGSGTRLQGATGIFGVFDVFGGRMLIGYESWIPPDNFSQTVRPWYTGAVLASGEISVTEPYLNEYSHHNTITLSRRIFDNNRRALGIVCLNIELGRISQHVLSTQFVEGGYGFLLSENFMIISHPDPEKVGMSFRDVKSEIPALEGELVEKGKISEVVARDYRGVRTIVFMERLQNGWYMGIVTPRESYLQSTRNLAIMLIILGAVFATILIRMLLRIYTTMLAETRKTEIAEESNKAKSDFLARVSHEIRTPMNAILGITEIQLQEEIRIPVYKEAFERIYNSGNLLLSIINDILDLSKIEAGKLEIASAKYDIASLIHDIVQINMMRYETKSLEFVLDVNENLPLLLIGDELRIKQILSNLLSNAFKYTEKGTVKLTVYAEEKTLVFVVSDTGQGMTPDQIEKLGTEYSRFNMETNRNTEGTGLGMNITQNLLKLMNGSLSVESTPGTGSIFTVRLPQEFADSTVIGKEMASNLMRLNIDNSVKMRAIQINREYMPYGRVLIVDDVETNLYVARGLLAPYGLSVETAMSGFEAIDKIKDGLTYDIIFMDHMMPRMDGIEAAKIIRGLGYSKPIVALTANALAGQAAIFMENGFDDFISKPIDTRQLNMTLNKLIRDKQTAEVVEAARKQKVSLHSAGGQKGSLGPDLAEIFVRDAKKAITHIESIYLNKFRRDDDLATFIINIHSMKSALANIGETALSAEAANLEQAGRENNTELILSQTPLFLEKLGSIIKKLEPMIITIREDADKNANAAGGNVSGDIQYLKEKLLALKNACAKYDKKTAKDNLAEVKKWSKSLHEQLSSMSAHLLHSEFDEAAKAIDSYIKHL
jgi:signal transduction histidine kinase/CheY-like chemotaxis protein/HPt (histidine-containing phosphotransfer) domain-containing protein